MLIKFPSFYFDAIQTIPEALTQADEHLRQLSEMLQDNMKLSAEEKNILAENVAYIKRFYERAELILLAPKK